VVSFAMQGLTEAITRYAQFAPDRHRAAGSRPRRTIQAALATALLETTDVVGCLTP
jgi:hypothetical protein